MSSIPDWQQICEAEYFNWCCTICNALAKSPLHLEDQFLVLHGVYTDINDDKWVKCTKCFSPYHVSCIQENPNPQQEYMCTFMACCK